MACQHESAPRPMMRLLPVSKVRCTSKHILCVRNMLMLRFALDGCLQAHNTTRPGSQSHITYQRRVRRTAATCSHDDAKGVVITGGSKGFGLALKYMFLLCTLCLALAILLGSTTIHATTGMNANPQIMTAGANASPVLLACHWSHLSSKRKKR